MIDRGEQKRDLGLNHRSREGANVDTNLFVKLISDLDEYNKDNSSGVTLGRFLVSMIDANSQVPEILKNIDGTDLGDQIPKTIKEEEVRRGISGAGLFVSYGSLLNDIGLSLEPVSGKKTVVFSSDGEIGNGEMRINIADGQKFISFLGELKPEMIPDSGLDKALGTISGFLIDQLHDQYNLYKGSNESLEFFGSMGLMIDQYKRLGLSGAANDLEIYYKYLKQGDLRDYILIKNKSLFDSLDGENFGPAHWQRDISPKLLEKKWKEALNILAEVKKNPKAVELYEQLKSHLLASISFSIKEIPGIEYLPSERKTQFFNILSQTKSELEKD